MVVARVLTLWSSAAVDCLQTDCHNPLLRLSLHGGSPLSSRLLHHVYTHWEHPLDGVRHQARTLFHNLLLAHQCCSDHTADPASDPFVTQLAQSLLALEWHVKGKYGALACLTEHLGAEYLLRLDATLSSRLLGLMGDQTLAPYASELLERLFISHKNQLCGLPGDGNHWMRDWHSTWVTPLLEVLCTARLDQTTYILDYFLPKLLRCSPDSLGHMVQALQEMSSGSEGRTGFVHSMNTCKQTSIFSCQHATESPAYVDCCGFVFPGSMGSRGALGALMTCLRAARAQGVLKAEEDQLWGGLVPLPLLRQALVHKHDQVRENQAKYPNIQCIIPIYESSVCYYLNN